MTYKYEPVGLHFEVDNSNALMKNLLSYHTFKAGYGTRTDGVGTFDLEEVGGAQYASSADSMFNGRCLDSESSGSKYLYKNFSGSSTLLPSGSQDFSMCAWVKPESLAANQAIASHYVTSHAQIAWFFGYTSAGKAWCHKGNTIGTAGTTLTGTSDTVGTGAWHFLYAYWDQDVGMGASIDNGTIDTAAHTQSMKAANSSLVIGAYDDGTAGVLDGLLGQWVMWNKILSTQEVTDMYNGGAGNFLNGVDAPNP